MDQKLIIALCGYARVGKDTIAEHLVKHHGFERIAFADPVRKAALAIDPIVLVDGHYNRLSVFVRKHGWDECKKSDDVRQLLQRVGTEGGREIHGKDCWTDLAVRTINRSDNDKFVFTDLRFPNEYELIRNLDGQVWRVTKPGIAPVNGHVSEQLNAITSQADATVNNDSTIEMLNSKIDVMMLDIYKGKDAACPSKQLILN